MLRDFIRTTDEAYSKQNLIKMEIDMLKVIEFQVTFPTAWRFMERYPEVLNNGSALLAEYLLELGQVEYALLKFKPSIQAAAASYLANIIINKNYNWKIENPSEKEMGGVLRNFIGFLKLLLCIR